MRALWPALAVLALGCTGVVSPLGLDEPIRVDSAILREGSLPTGTDGPAITSVATNSGVWGRGQYDLGVLGRADEETYAIALRLRGVGSGYWTVPVGALDPAYPGERSWGALVDVGGGLPAGARSRSSRSTARAAPAR